MKFQNLLNIENWEGNVPKNSVSAPPTRYIVVRFDRIRKPFLLLISREERIVYESPSKLLNEPSSISKTLKYHV